MYSCDFLHLNSDVLSLFKGSFFVLFFVVCLWTEAIFFSQCMGDKGLAWDRKALANLQTAPLVVCCVRLGSVSPPNMNTAVISKSRKCFSSFALSTNEPQQQSGVVQTRQHLHHKLPYSPPHTGDDSTLTHRSERHAHDSVIALWQMINTRVICVDENHEPKFSLMLLSFLWGLGGRLFFDEYQREVL